MSKLVILGAQESGTGAALLAKKQGYDVFVSDGGLISNGFKDQLLTADIEFEEGMHTMNRILSADEVIKSPGIPENIELMKQVRGASIPVLSEIEFGARYTDATIVGITGTNGKTTTTMLTYHILSSAGLDVGVAGNVGSSFARQVAENDKEFFVLELSSFQLDDIHVFRPHISVLLNITPDHLDRYDNDMGRYMDSKFRITMNQTESDHFIYCDDDETVCAGLVKHSPKANRLPFSLTKSFRTGAYADADSIHINTTQKQFSMSILNLALQGKHNIYNSLAAGLTARVLEVRDDLIRESLSDFKNVEHRLEYVATANGITYINDSKATNVNAAWYALESMKKPVIWIAGGVDKGNDYRQLKNLVKDKVKMIICLGKDNEALVKAFGKVVPSMYEVDSAYEAVKAASQMGEPGDTVLLSPACASFDLFKNYEDRGMQFKHAVMAL
jgi:UDP-N-acetylmuramoylalanine--D-glutamate ligase